MVFNIFDNEAACANCAHYCQHYINHEYLGFTPCNSGHCIRLNIKARKPGGKVCEHFIFKEVWKE